MSVGRFGSPPDGDHLLTPGDLRGHVFYGRLLAREGGGKNAFNGVELVVLPKRPLSSRAANACIVLLCAPDGVCVLCARGETPPFDGAPIRSLKVN